MKTRKLGSLGLVVSEIGLGFVVSLFLYQSYRKQVIILTIAEVSKEYGLTADTLRYYERIGLIPPVRRNSSGIRDYSEEDCNWVNFIKCMRNAGLSIEILIEYVKMFQQGNSSIKARKDLLIEQRNQLAEKIVAMKQTLERLDYKIEGYEDILLKKEKQLEKGKEENDN